MKKTKMASLLAIGLLFPHIAIADAHCKPNIIPSTPTGRFDQSNLNGVVTDKQTGLMWMRCSLDQPWASGTCGVSNGDTYTWQEAFTAAEGHSFAGYSDWRLPNVKELASIMEVACSSPAMNIEIFLEAQQQLLWSSSPSASDDTQAWAVGVSNGGEGTYTKFSGGAVRLVRAGQ